MYELRHNLINCKSFVFLCFHQYSISSEEMASHKVCDINMVTCVGSVWRSKGKRITNTFLSLSAPIEYFVPMLFQIWMNQGLSFYHQLHIFPVKNYGLSGNHFMCKYIMLKTAWITHRWIVYHWCLTLIRLHLTFTL